MRLIDGDELLEILRILQGVYFERKRTLGKVVEEVKRMPTIEPEPKWIHVSDPPDTERNVFIARGESDNMSVCIGHYSNEYKQWYEDRNWFGMLLYDGLYWCEIPTLPEPYREEGEADESD